MKFIATRNFFRVPSLGGLEIEGALNPKLIHKGALFEIGTGNVLKEMRKEDRELIALLHFSKCIGDATDPKIVQAVKDEIALDKRREANIAKINAEVLDAGLARQLVNVLNGMAANAK